MPKAIVTIHACFMCTCTPGVLCDHCEGHFEGVKIPCQPCPFGKSPEHFLEADYDGTFWCSGCFTELPSFQLIFVDQPARLAN